MSELPVRTHAHAEDALVAAVGDEIWVDLGPHLAEGDPVNSAIEDAAINVIRIVREHDRGAGSLVALFEEYDRLRVEGPNGSASYLLYGAAKVLDTTIRQLLDRRNAAVRQAGEGQARDE